MKLFKIMIFEKFLKQKYMRLTYTFNLKPEYILKNL